MREKKLFKQLEKAAYKTGYFYFRGDSADILDNLFCALADRDAIDVRCSYTELPVVNPHRVYKVWVDIEERYSLPSIYWWGLERVSD